jgi:hypothetical protein
MIPSPDSPSWIAAALGAAGDVAYDLDLATDRLSLGGPVDALLGPGASAPTEGLRPHQSRDLPARLPPSRPYRRWRLRLQCRLRDTLGRVH